MKKGLAIGLCAALLLTGCAGTKAKDEKKIPSVRAEATPVVIDVDTGTDDAIALAFAKKCAGIDVRGVTVVQGCVDLRQAGENTLAVCNHLGLDVPVALGADRPLVGEPITDPINHGESGLGKVELPKPKMKVSELSATRCV